MDTAGAATGGHAGYSGVCPFTVDKPVMRQRWERLTFLHWSYDPDVVQRLLPGGLTVDTFGGAAWVGLVPFFMRVHTPGDHGAPWVSNFCETNVRTYAVDREGRAGIWFLSLDAARLGAVAVARASYQLPYFWSSMRISGPLTTQSRTGDQEITYSCQRRLPGPRTAISQVRVRAGAPVPARRAGGPGPLPDRPVGAVQRAGRAPVLRPRRAPAVAAAPRGGAHRGRQPDDGGGPARTPR